MHLRLDDLRKQARMLQMYQWERTRRAERDASVPSSSPQMIEAEPVAGMEAATPMADPVQPID